MTIEQMVNFGLHKTTRPASILTKYQFPVIQSIRIISTANKDGKDHSSISVFWYLCEKNWKKNN